MNSQDKSLESEFTPLQSDNVYSEDGTEELGLENSSTDNGEVRDVDLSEHNNQTTPQHEELESDFEDLWSEDSELVTDIIVDESLDLQDARASVAETLEPQSDKQEDEFDLELSEWDFRNPLSNPPANTKDGQISEHNIEEASELEQVSNTEALTMEEFDEELSTTELEEIDLVEDLASESLELPEPDEENDLLEEPEFVNLDNQSSATEEIDLVEDLASESLELPELDEENDLLEESEFVNLDNQSSATESLASLDLDDSLELENIELTGLENDSDWQLELSEDSLAEPIDSISHEGSDNLNDLDNLDNLNLENLLVSETQPELLDSTDLGGSLDTIESELDLDLDSGLDNLAAIVGIEEKTELQSPPQSPSVISPVSVTSDKSTSEVGEPSAKAFDPTMRVSVRRLDNLNNLIGELVVKRNRLEEDQERLRRFLDNLLGHVQSLGDAGVRMHDTYERSLLEGALIASRQSSAVASGKVVRANSFLSSEEKSQPDALDALEMDRFTGFHLLSQEIIELIVRVREAAADIQYVVDESDKVTQSLRQVTSQLQEGMNSSRMVAFGLTADRLPRAVREVSRQQKKQAKLHVEGKDVLIDKMIVEHLYNPMTHLVNNAISHGIESPQERTESGKPAAGTISIKAFIQGNQTVITVADDGAGIDSEKVKNKAVERNLITWAQAQKLTQPEIYDLLFHPGFSTKDSADDFAGRGVGMDVVLTDLKKIRGTIGIESKKGKGTTFTIRLPLVLSICKALICVDNNNPVAFPIDGVEDTLECFAHEIKVNTNGVKSISWQNNILPLRPLSSLLNYNRKMRRGSLYTANHKDEDTTSVVILRSVDRLLAVEVDEVQTEQEIVIKQIEGSLPKPPGIAGATVLGDGKIIPIGDVLELIEVAQGKRTIKFGFSPLDRASEAKVRNEPSVLVVDDSITVRELLSMSFNKLGYRVEQARDGQEAWDKLRGGLPCDMIFCDIEMPRMNGLELLSNLQKHQDLKGVPVAMLTSRGADKHRQLASELGAKAYLTKPYTEKDLMDVAQRLIEFNKTNVPVESNNSAAMEVAKSNSNGLASANSETNEAPLVLVIDDSVTVRELLSMTFKKAGFRVEQARDGKEAWDKLKGGLPCDLAFCDIEMPRMNGLELLSQLQQDAKLSTLPIAMLTSRGAQKMRNIAAEKGAKGYFVKPYVEDYLLEAARKMLDGEILLDRIELD